MLFWHLISEINLKILLIDVKNAHLNGILSNSEEVYVELPSEAGAPGMCGKLRRSLYGMKPAASVWEHACTTWLEAMGFNRGHAAPTVLHNCETAVRCVVHADNFTFLG